MPRAAGQRPPPSPPSARRVPGAQRTEPGLRRLRRHRGRKVRREGGTEGGRHGEGRHGGREGGGCGRSGAGCWSRSPASLSRGAEPVPAARQQCQGLPAAPRPPPRSLLPRPPRREGGQALVIPTVGKAGACGFPLKGGFVFRGSDREGLRLGVPRDLSALGQRRELRALG